MKRGSLATFERSQIKLKMMPAAHMQARRHGVDEKPWQYNHELEPELELSNSNSGWATSGPHFAVAIYDSTVGMGRWTLDTSPASSTLAAWIQVQHSGYEFDRHETCNAALPQVVCSATASSKTKTDEDGRSACCLADRASEQHP